MKLKTVSTYQTVRFNKADERHFDAAIPRFKGIELTYEKEFVRIKMGDEQVLVFPTNIAYVVPLPEAEKSSKKDAK